MPIIPDIFSEKIDLGDLGHLDARTPADDDAIFAPPPPKPDTPPPAEVKAG